MKKRKLKTRRPLNNNIDVKLWYAFDELTKELSPRVNKSVLLDEAIELLLQKYGKEIPGKGEPGGSE